MFDQVRFIPVTLPVISESVACRAITSLYKPNCPEHIGQMMKSPFKSEVKGAHLENYDKMHQTGTWSYPVLRSLIPRAAVLLPIRPVYTIKPTSKEFLWEPQVRSCANGAHMVQCIHYEESFAPVASIENIPILLNLGASQGNSVYDLDVKNALQNMIHFDPEKFTYNMLPPSFAE
jgi:hypothetical protein